MADRRVTSEAAHSISATHELGRRLLTAAVSASPMIAFTAILSATRSLSIAAAVAVSAAIVVTGWRIAAGRPRHATVVLVAVVALQVTLAAVSGNAANFFLPRLVWMVLWSPVHLVLILIGWPPLGWAVGQLRGQGWAWRRCRAQRRAYMLASLLPWSLATMKMVVSLWLYAHGRVALLGGAELLFHALHFAAFLAAWRIAVRLVGAHRCPALSTADPLGQPIYSCVSTRTPLQPIPALSKEIP